MVLTVPSLSDPEHNRISRRSKRRLHGLPEQRRRATPRTEISTRKYII